MTHIIQKTTYKNLQQTGAYLHLPSTLTANPNYPSKPDTDTITPPFDESLFAKKLHIVLVTETWLPDINGVAMSLYQLMRQLVMMGHQVSLIRPKVAKKATKTTTTQVEVAAVDDTKANITKNLVTHDVLVKGLPIPCYTNLQFGLPACRRLRQHLAQIKPDIVHIATEGPLGLAALWVAKRLHIPVTTGYHTQFHNFSQHFGWGIIAKPLMAYFKRFHNVSAATCVPSLSTQQALSTLGFKNLWQVGRGVDTDHYHPNKRSDALRQQWGVGQQHTVLMMVSRLSPEKQVDLVIQAFKALQSQQLHRAMKLVIVGDGPDRQRLESLAKQSSDDILFVGMQTGDNLAAHYASGDAFVFASQVETFGNVVTEAMASGLPVFAFDDAAAGMLVDDNCGGLAALGDTQGFIDIVVNLPKVQTLREQGKQARQKVMGFSWQRPAMQMHAMFVSAIHKLPIPALTSALPTNLSTKLVPKTKMQCERPLV